MLQKVFQDQQQSQKAQKIPKNLKNAGSGPWRVGFSWSYNFLTIFFGFPTQFYIPLHFEIIHFQKCLKFDDFYQIFINVFNFISMCFGVVVFGSIVHILPTCHQGDISKQELLPFFILFIYYILFVCWQSLNNRVEKTNGIQCISGKQRKHCEA